MKENVKELVRQALSQWVNAQRLDIVIPDEVYLERTKQIDHGDFACNVALSLAKSAKCSPRQIAEQLVAHFPKSALVEKIDIAGPGFLNIFLSQAAVRGVLKEVIAQGEHYGKLTIGQGKRVSVEFVSANPTGPLHVGHGRGAALGAALSSVLRAAGFEVHCEYYVNDAGRQMDILAVSVWLRYLALCGETIVFPSNGYQGEYVFDIARALKADVGDDYRIEQTALWADIPADVDASTETGDKEAHIDGLIGRAKAFLGDRYHQLHAVGLHKILADIKDDLNEFGVKMDEWFSEQSLLHSDALKDAIDRLQKNNQLYEKDGALWFRSTDFGDDKDRVVQRANGTHTYFASDIAYHASKYRRGFDKIIDIFGADHHGYVARTRAGVEAMGFDASQLQILLVQFAILYRGEERVSMSTRAGSFVALRELREEVGKDAARFFYVMRKCEQHMDFDLELAKSKSNENPVYYIQYAHARVCSVMRQMAEKGMTHDLETGWAQLSGLNAPEEQVLFRMLAKYPEVIEAAALSYEPHIIAHYLRELANHFHIYYNTHRFLSSTEAVWPARINMILAVRQVISNGLHLLGVSAPEVM